MARQSRSSSIKDADTYEALREEGASKEKAARIANSRARGDEPSKKGGKADPYEAWTRDALYQRAKEIGIDGRSKMNKADLIDALRNH
ncbi:Rho termination factor N-terminal domain-containing protein [Acuticoccus sp. MNP-M23]|uniref:DUF7218 family protein n=1 Tax=Acuticoccus sp. MNP-M23 TaxID=3072793 RepID=UPI002815223C|nr:Rho termination factor N-terminal domain-containing protein [Acuticoccus sp. MNP-M23]WMS42690.1 Rho termination factor N-terminal domain-containing protein [Acuticoccus sp. MNP-M23]